MKLVSSGGGRSPSLRRKILHDQYDSRRVLNELDCHVAAVVQLRDGDRRESTSGEGLDMPSVRLTLSSGTGIRADGEGHVSQNCHPEDETHLL